MRCTCHRQPPSRELPIRSYTKPITQQALSLFPQFEKSKCKDPQVFYTKHIDGPYYYVPFASQFRMIIGTDENQEITTKWDCILGHPLAMQHCLWLDTMSNLTLMPHIRFPMVPTECAAQTGDVLTFDFHRYIECPELRVLVQLGVRIPIANIPCSSQGDPQHREGAWCRQQGFQDCFEGSPSLQNVTHIIRT